MDKIDQQYLNEIVGGTEGSEVDTQHDLKVHEENTTIEELEVNPHTQGTHNVSRIFIMVPQDGTIVLHLKSNVLHNWNNK